ncbi:glycosyltransferase 87 family protein [Streptomyces sp. NPDC004609]|uniref:glycosyltransferase 87 family protein n=1 Tax=Streptomyces sp. NPDC004609 TaxID=3364704 RepID=UPI0036894B09
MTYRTVSLRSLTIVFALALAALCTARRVPMADTLAYGFTVTAGQLPTGHPPFAAILLVPATWLPATALKVAFVAGNALLLALLVRLCCRVAGLNAPVPVLLAALAAGTWLEPDVTLALVCLVLWDLSRDERAIGKGFPLGVAAGVALTPAVFILYLLFTGRVRASLTALASLTATVLLGALVLPHASADFWGRRVLDTLGAGIGGAHQLAWYVPLLAVLWLSSRTHAPAPGIEQSDRRAGPAAGLG